MYAVKKRLGARLVRMEEVFVIQIMERILKYWV